MCVFDYYHRFRFYVPIFTNLVVRQAVEVNVLVVKLSSYFIVKPMMISLYFENRICSVLKLASVSVSVLSSKPKPKSVFRFSHIPIMETVGIVGLYHGNHQVFAKS